MVALEEVKDDDKFDVVKTLIELGASVAFKNKVSVSVGQLVCTVKP